MKFNPSIKELLEERKGITLLGLYWAMYWRLFVLVMGIYIAVALVVAIFTIAYGS